jgi:carbonic anhydrase
VVLCGHTSCGGAAAALSDSRVGGVLDTWLTPLKSIKRQHKAELEAIPDAGKKAIKLAELNVEKGVETILSNVVVEEAIKERGLRVHGVLFDIASGRLRDLGLGNGKGNGLASIRGESEAGDVVRGNHGMLVFGGDGATMALR